MRQNCEFRYWNKKKSGSIIQTQGGFSIAIYFPPSLCMPESRFIPPKVHIERDLFQSPKRSKRRRKEKNAERLIVKVIFYPGRRVCKRRERGINVSLFFIYLRDCPFSIYLSGGSYFVMFFSTTVRKVWKEN